MNTILDTNSIGPKDTAAFQDLHKQEQNGESGFAAFYHGDQKAGFQEMSQALQQSNADIRSIHDASLHKQAKELMGAVNDAMRQYVKDPSDANLSNLKTEAADYKQFLVQFPQ